MTSPLCDCMDRWITAWEAATPPDRIGITYHSWDGKQRQDHISGDRCFFFDLPMPEKIIGEGAEYAQFEWELRVILRLCVGGRSLIDAAKAVANEVVLLRRTIDLVGNWASGILACETTAVDVERDEETGDAILTFRAHVLTREA